MPGKKLLSQTKVWRQPIKMAADPPRVRHFLDHLGATPLARELARASAEQARLLAALFSGSPALSALLVKHPEWMAALRPEHLRHPRREQGLRREVNAWLQPAIQARDYTTALARLRQFKQREMLRIGARDLARLGGAPEVTREISNVADVCLTGVLQLCYWPLAERFGQPYHQDARERWQPTGFAVVGLGKLGGEELNYSSDVDVIFVYGEEGQVFKEPPRPGAAKDHGLANHQFFKRLAESFIAEVSRTTPDGSLFRIDLRLRPEGSAGPLARSLGSYENFYAQWGQTWERMMLIKARGVAGDPALAAEFLEMIQPFRYPRSVGANVRREIAAMKARLETEVVKAGEIDRNVKLGRGGIREIEFIVQSQQLLHAGRLPFLQGAQTLPGLQKLAQYKLLAVEEAESLAAAYCFLRDVEHRLQMEHHLQTHTIPTHRPARARLAALMGFASRKAFEAAREHHARRVRQIYERLFHDENPEAASRFPGQFEGAAGEWQALLARHGFRDLATSFRLLNEFAHGPGYVHVSSRTTELAWQLLEKFFVLCPDRANRSPSARLPSPVLSDPDRVLTRLDSFIGAYGARAVLFETWASNPSLFDLWLLLFDRSEFLAELAIRTPDLVDELMLSGHLRRRKTADETLADLRHGRADADQRLWLRRYHEAELMRIGLRDILGLADFEQNLAELSALADACLRYALEVVLRENRMKTSPLAVIGLGKLGGQELDYGADLDIIFIANGKAKDFSKLQRIAAAVMDLLSRQTELGMVFKTDARLRPDGEKGLLVNTLAAHEEYYHHRAQLWEIQALTRARVIAGPAQVGEGFRKLAATLTNFRHPSRPLAALRPDWRQEIARMRRRIESERTPPGEEAGAIKTGAGGLIDAEFIAQTLCLANGWAEPNTLRALQRAKETDALEPADADRLIASYRQLRRVEGILRRWSFEGETVLPADPEPFYRVAIRCGFATAEAFRDAIAQFRRAIREVYEQVFPSGRTRPDAERTKG